MAANQKADKIKKPIVGEVVSDKMDKTIVIKVKELSKSLYYIKS